MLPPPAKQLTPIDPSSNSPKKPTVETPVVSEAAPQLDTPVDESKIDSPEEPVVEAPKVEEPVVEETPKVEEPVRIVYLPLLVHC